jgi:hypothetical protein
VTANRIGADADQVAVKRLGNAFCEAKLLLSAVELGVFTALDAGSATEGELRERLDLQPRGVRDFLDALVVLGLLERSGERYANSRAASRVLVRGKDSYAGGFLERANRMLYPAWGRLTEALRTGAPQAADALGAMQADPAKLAQYLDMMDSVNVQLVPDILASLPWAQVGTVVDVGGARGNLVGRIAQAHPALRGAVFDLPAIAPAAAAHLTALGVADRISYRSGDFFTDPLPRAEVVVIGHVLHNWSPDQRAALVKRAYDAVLPGGALLVYDAMLDPERGSLSTLLVSLNMLLVTAGGGEYTVDECAGYLRAAGFGEIAGWPIGATDTLIVGRKAGDGSAIQA